MVRRLAKLVAALAALACGLVFTASPASAHNALASSDPPDGATVASAPAQLSMTFAEAVPLDTASLEIVDDTGARRAVTGLSHGPGGATNVVAALPPLSGAVTFRWKLVGSDGHVVSGRIAVTIAVTIAEAAADPATNDPSATSVVPPAGSDPASTTGTPAAIDEAANRAGGPTATRTPADPLPYTTPSGARWLLRMVAYLAMLAIVGVVASIVFVAGWLQAEPVVTRTLLGAFTAVAATALAQLLVIASDIDGLAPWSAAGALDAAWHTDAGRALGWRIGLALLGAWVAYRATVQGDRRWWSVALGIGGALLATWAYAGHAASLRWSALGVPIDIAHHGAAGAWLGGLAVVGIVALRSGTREELLALLPRFSRLAARSVAVVAATGIVQGARLEGAPWRALQATHGRLLLLKLVLLAGMLAVADVNRRRVAIDFGASGRATARNAELLRRSVGTELGIGLVILGVTAAMVVSPPASTKASATHPDPPATTRASIVTVTRTVTAAGARTYYVL